MEVNMDEPLCKLISVISRMEPVTMRWNSLTTVTREKLCMFVTIGFVKRDSIPYGIVVSNVVEMHFERCIIVM